jgi:hypothetical protein
MSMRDLAATLALLSIPAGVLAQTVTIPAGTRIFGELQEEVSSDIKEHEVGDFVTGHVWRNVIIDGRTVIEAGAPMTLQVSDIQKRRTFGRAGNVEVRAVSVVAVDGSEIFLDGGYDRKGESRVVLSSTLAALVAWPTLFIKGKEAILPPGTIFDAAVPANTNVDIVGSQRPTLSLGNLSNLEVEVLYDEIEEDDKDLPILVQLCDQPWSEPFAVTAVNDAEIKVIEIETDRTSIEGDCTVTRGLIDLKDLSKEFAKGINRFTVAVGNETAEVILDVEM